MELGFTGNPTNKYAIEIDVVANEYGLRLEPGSQLFDTLVGMVEARPEIEAVLYNTEEILVEMKPDVLEAELLNRDMDDGAPFREAYAPVLEEKKKANAEYRQAKAQMRELLLAKENVDRLLGTTGRGREAEPERTEL